MSKTPWFFSNFIKTALYTHVLLDAGQVPVPLNVIVLAEDVWLLAQFAHSDPFQYVPAEHVIFHGHVFFAVPGPVETAPVGMSHNSHVFLFAAEN